MGIEDSDNTVAEQAAVQMQRLSIEQPPEFEGRASQDASTAKRAERERYMEILKNYEDHRHALWNVLRIAADELKTQEANLGLEQGSLEITTLTHTGTGNWSGIMHAIDNLLMNKHGSMLWTETLTSKYGWTGMSIKSIKTDKLIELKDMFGLAQAAKVRENSEISENNGINPP